MPEENIASPARNGIEGPFFSGYCLCELNRQNSLINVYISNVKTQHNAKGTLKRFCLHQGNITRIKNPAEYEAVDREKINLELCRFHCPFVGART